jgi:hypothetical protein
MPNTPRRTSDDSQGFTHRTVPLLGYQYRNTQSLFHGPSSEGALDNLKHARNAVAVSFQNYHEQAMTVFTGLQHLMDTGWESADHGIENNFLAANNEFRALDKLRTELAPYAPINLDPMHADYIEHVNSGGLPRGSELPLRGERTEESLRTLQQESRVPLVAEAIESERNALIAQQPQRREGDLPPLPRPPTQGGPSQAGTAWQNVQRRILESELSEVLPTNASITRPPRREDHPLPPHRSPETPTQSDHPRPGPGLGH